MTADFGFIVQTAQRHAYILALHGCCDAFAQTGLSYARRTVEAGDRTLAAAVQCSYGEEFQDALLYFLHAVVVVVQNALGTGQTEVVLGVGVPRQIYHGLQESNLYRIVRTLLVQRVELGDFFLEDFGGFLAPVLCFCLLQNLLLLRTGVAFSQFFPDVLDLLLEEVFLLLLIQIVVGFVLNLCLDAEQMAHLVQRSDGNHDALAEIFLFQHLDFVLDGERKEGAHEVALHVNARQFVDSLDSII